MEKAFRDQQISQQNEQRTKYIYPTSLNGKLRLDGWIKGFWFCARGYITYNKKC